MVHETCVPGEFILSVLWKVRSSGRHVGHGLVLVLVLVLVVVVLDVLCLLLPSRWHARQSALALYMRVCYRVHLSVLLAIAHCQGLSLSHLLTFPLPHMLSVVFLIIPNPHFGRFPSTSSS